MEHESRVCCTDIEQAQTHRIIESAFLGRNENYSIHNPGGNNFFKFAPFK